MPVEKNIENIMLGQPSTEKSELKAFIPINMAKRIEMADSSKPSVIANLSGLSEKDIIISKASFNLFLIVYEGFPLNLSPCGASMLAVG